MGNAFANDSAYEYKPSLFPEKNKLIIAICHFKLKYNTFLNLSSLTYFQNIFPVAYGMCPNTRIRYRTKLGGFWVMEERTKDSSSSSNIALHQLHDLEQVILLIKVP